MRKFLTRRRASGVISSENSQRSFPKRGTANSIAGQLVNDDVGNASAEQRRLRNGLALAESLSRAGDAMGNVLGARAWLYHFRCAPGFCEQGANEPRVWPDEFEIGFARDGARRGKQLLLLCGGGGSSECDSTGCGTYPGAGVYVRLDQSGDRAGGGPLDFDGLAICAR